MLATVLFVILSSPLLSKNLKIEVYKTIFLLVVLYGFETWPLTLREEHGLVVSENREMRSLFGHRGKKLREAGEDCIMRSVVTCTLYQVL
jgi:predicted ABC-type exoprotein transport system permease subunit